ncbi:pentapeptide repeat-containing protein [Pseudonocardia sp. CA-107938]|uniref:pentapeptide repeat-containing protein n=1 Tax=Pseudonocardia sp. CA-107938 TaxID=3240021 RepID=UPI003D90BF98
MARRTSSRKAPKLRPDPPLGPEEFDPAPAEVESGAFWDCVEAGPDLVVPEHVPGWRVQESRLVGVDLAGRRLSGLVMRDTELVRCDLSGAVLDGAGLERVAFTGCRLTGTVLSGTRLTDVLIADCRADLLNLRMADASSLVVEESNLRGVDLYELTAQNCAFLGCDLTGAVLDNAKLTGTRLHRSTIADVRGALALRGCVIGPDQQLPVGVVLLDALGIDVTD